MGEDLGTRLLSKHKRAVDREFAGYPGPDVLFECASQGPCFRLRFCGSALDGLVARSKAYVSAGFNQRFLKDTDYPGAELAKIRKIAAPAQEDAPCPVICPVTPGRAIVPPRSLCGVSSLRRSAAPGSAYPRANGALPGANRGVRPDREYPQGWRSPCKCR